MKLIETVRENIEKKLDDRLRKQKISRVRVLLQSSLVGIVCWVLFGIAAAIILSAPRLGVWFLPALLGYFGLVWGLSDWLKEQIRKRDARLQLGDEVYYAAFPDELRKKELREKRKKEGRKMKLFKWIKSVRWTILWPVIETSLWVWPGIFLILVSVQIMLHADVLGVFYWPVLFSYFALLIAGFGLTQFRKNKRDLRGVIGDDLYFQLYPKEKLRMERRRARQERLKKSERDIRGQYV